MARAIIEREQQAAFLAEVRERLAPITWKRMAEICKVSRRTLRNWRKEKLRISHEALVTLHELSGVPLPIIIEIISEEEHRYRASRRGAQARYELYGNPGTLEGRCKGGQRGLRELRRRARENPELYPHFRDKKEILLPEKSPRLAELVGILLGDGGITDFQVRVTSHREKEVEYSHFVSELLTDLFGVEAPLVPDGNTGIVIVSSVAVVGFLLSIGLKKGNKVEQQVGVPDWIFSDREYMRACIRGLMDTDGGVYPHSYKVGGKMYHYVKMNFTNHSIPLLDGMERMLVELGFTAKNDRKRHVSLYRQAEVGRYLNEIGTNNLYHLRRFHDFARRFWGEDLAHIGLYNLV